MNALIYSLLELIQTTFTSATNSETILAGGLWYGRAPQEAVVPYGIITIEDGKKTFTTNGYFLQNLSMKIMVYTSGGVSNQGLKNIASLMSNAFDFTCSNTAIDGGKVVIIQPISNMVALEPQLRDAEDVVTTSFVWQIVLSGGTLI